MGPHSTFIHAGPVMKNSLLKFVSNHCVLITLFNIEINGKKKRKIRRVRKEKNCTHSDAAGAAHDGIIIQLFMCFS